MTESLWEEIRTHIRARPSPTIVPEDQAEDLVRRVGERFVRDRSRRHWWEVLHGPSHRIPYGEGDGLELLAKWLGKSRPIYLVVTDDEFPPWRALRGTVGEIVEVLRECPWFEYWLTDDSGSFVLFDTHHNEFLASGAIEAELRCQSNFSRA